MVTVSSHQRRMTSGRFVPVKQHSRVATVKGVKGRFLLSRAPWTIRPSGYRRANGTIRVPRTGQVYRGGKLQSKSEPRGRHFYGAGK